MKKLHAGQKHILNLIAEGVEVGVDGWTPVSKAMFPVVNSMPSELVVLESLGDGCGRTRLTEKGQSLIEAMKWL